MNESKATRYQRLRRRSQVISLAAGFGLLLVAVLTGTADGLADLATRVSLAFPPSVSAWVALVVFVGLLALAAEIVAFPAALVAAARGAGRKRTDSQDESLMASQARDALTGATIALVVAALVRLAMFAGGPWWWLLASVMLACSTLVAMGLLSLGLSLSSESRPLGRTSLLGPLNALAERACGRRIPVREWDPASGPGAAAVVTGIGSAGKVLLSTAMVRDWAEDEIAVVVAHELSHHAHHDLARKVAVDAVLWCVTLGFADRAIVWWGPRVGVHTATELAALPILAVVAGAIWCLLRPLRLIQSRAHERRADAFALALTNNPEAFGRALRRLGEAHLAEERPSTLTRWFFHRHPTIEERLAANVRQAGPTGHARLR